MSKEVIGATIGGIAIIVGAIITGFYTLQSQQTGGPVAAPRPPGQEEAVVDVTIYDQLGEGEMKPY
jgi:hypothetical protein